MFKDYIVKIIVEYLLKNLTQEKIDALIAMAKGWLLPKLRLYKDEICAALRASINASPDKYDAILLLAVDKLEFLLESVLPDNATHL